MYNDVNFPKGANSDELRLLLALLENDNGAELAYEYRELLQGVNWNQLIELARHHRVFPYINRKLQGLKSSDIPGFVTQMFQRDYYRNTLLMLTLSGEMEKLATLFTERHIRTLFLKGPVIAADLYGDVSLRTSSDLDILIPIQDLERTEELLESTGYEKNDYITTVLNDWKWRHHHSTFYHPDKKIKVEVHWRLNPFPSKEPSFEKLWSRRRKSALISRPIYYLGREDLFMFLVSHGARHGWSRLRWLLDIKQLMNQKMDWQRLTILLRKHQYLHLGSQALVLAARLLAAPLHEEMKPLLASRKGEWLAEDAMFYIQRMVNLHSPPIPREVEQYHQKYLFSLLTFRQKLLFLASFMFPYPEDAEMLRLPKSLHFLYFPLRPVLWAWRRLRKKHAADETVQKRREL